MTSEPCLATAWRQVGGKAMRINEVERLVDITKKNIRFYEEQGLLNPARNEVNRYRDYSNEDVEVLRKIKLFRKLNVPISEIRRMQEGHLPLEDCLCRHIITLEREEKNIAEMKTFCGAMIQAQEQFSGMDASVYLQKMEQMEKGGVAFVDAKRTDKKSRKRHSIIAGSVMIVFMGLMIALFAYCTWGISEDPMPVFMFLIFSLPLAAVIVATIMVMRERMKEIEGGEIYEASKY